MVLVVDTGAVVMGRVGSTEHATNTHKSKERRRMEPDQPYVRSPTTPKKSRYWL
jgi:hypothetical protein